MTTTTSLLTHIMQLPEAQRFAIAMTILDADSPSAMGLDEIEAEAARRQDEMDNGSVTPMSFDELVAGLTYRPRSIGA